MKSAYLTHYFGPKLALLSSPLLLSPTLWFLKPQQKKDIQAFGYAWMNTLRTIPIISFCILDYTYTLNGLEYGTEEYFKQQSILNRRVANRLLRLFVKNRGIYIKAGQYIGSLDSIAPKEYVEVFKCLQDEGPSVPFEDIKIVVEHDFQWKLEDIYESFDQKPIAAASLAQVHRAVLKKNKQPVAVKLQFPTLGLQTKYDMKVATFWVKIIDKVALFLNFKGVNLHKLYNDFQESRYTELDFELELENGVRTTTNFSDDDRIYVPKFYREYSGKRWITMEFIDNAYRIDDIDRIKTKYGVENTNKFVCQALIDIFAKQIFLYGLVHADGHPGNILVREHPNIPGRPQIVLLDHGHYWDVDDKFRLKFCNLWYYLCTFNYDKVKEIAAEFGITTHYKYLPLIFTYRTMNSKKSLGERMTSEEIKMLKKNDDLNLENIGYLVQKLPWDIILIFKATHLITTHIAKFGSNDRTKIFRFSNYWVQALVGSNTGISYWMLRLTLMFKILLFEYCYPLFKLFYGHAERHSED